MTMHFRDIYKTWFENKKYWFDKKQEYDILLCDTYFENIKNHKELNIDSLENDKEIQIGAIIAYDQLPRHYDRLYPNVIDCNEYSKQASYISLKYLQSIYNEKSQNDITIEEWCFILMPFRHLQDVEKIKNSANFMIMKYINATKTELQKNICKNFIYHSIKSIYPKITEKCIMSQTKDNDTDENKDLQWEQFNNLLDFCPNKKMNFDISNYTNNNIVREFVKELKNIDVDNTNVIVSLSGGVDSCTCLFLMKYFYPKHNYVAVFINYNNRKESPEEVKFVKKFCNVLGVKCFHRKVTEISRNDCHKNGLRDIYESLTKDIRFDTYRQISNMNKDMKHVVLLGHNKDDCFENIITNISAKHNYNNLSGTEHMVSIDNIQFWRPVLNVRKAEIIEFAHKTHIPYLIDSTPKWSTRGKIRDNVLKSLQDINPDIINSYFALQDHIKENDDIVRNYILPNILNKIKKEKEVYSIEFSKQELICVHNIWKSIFKEIFDNNVISYKSTQQFIDYLNRFKNKFDKMHENNIINYRTKFILNNNIYANICRNRNDNIYITFHTKSNN